MKRGVPGGCAGQLGILAGAQEVPWGVGPEVVGIRIWSITG